MNEYSKYLTLKNSVEDIFGSDAWYALKESNHIPTWKRYSINILKALRQSILDTVEIYDDDWLKELHEYIDYGISNIKHQKEIDEVIAVLTGTLISLSFHQVGFKPKLKSNRRKPVIRKGQWKLNQYRTVAYMQSATQKENLFLDKQRKKIGFDAQLILQSEYRKSKSKLTYEQWCIKNGNL